MDMTTYILPDGTEVAVDATAAKGAAVIGFTLKGGQIVEATRKGEMPRLYQLLDAEMSLQHAEDCLWYHGKQWEAPAEVSAVREACKIIRVGREKIRAEILAIERAS